MGGSPKVVQQDPEANAKAAADKAAAEANTKKSMRRTSTATGSVLGGQMTDQAKKTTLGGG